MQDHQELLKKAEYLMTTGAYQDVKRLFNTILEDNIEVAEVWYKKAKIPIVVQYCCYYRRY